MATSGIISSKGQVTIPVEVRRRLGVKAGDSIEFAFEDGRTVLRPARLWGNPFEAFVGALPAFSTKEETHAWIREMRGDDPEEAVL